MDPDHARALVAAEPVYLMQFGEGRSCSLCGANVHGGDEDTHTRWHQALAVLHGVGWDDLAAVPSPPERARRAGRAVDPASGDLLLADAVGTLVRPGGLARVTHVLSAALPWRVLWSVPVEDVGDGELHLLVGPPGLVALRLADRPGERVDVGSDDVRVGGHRTGLVDRLRAEARRLEALLGSALRGRHRVPVVPALVVVGTVSGDGPGPDGVVVATPESLPRRLRALPEVVTEAQADALYEIARRSSTWA